MSEPIFSQVRKDMEEVLKLVTQDLAMIKTGRAKPSLIENVKVEAYPGQHLTVKELANIITPDPHLLVVQPWDESILDKLEKALSESEMHLNPVVDKNLIRISIPPLTAERRDELVKLVNQRIESGKQMLRDVRQSAKSDIEDQKGEPGVSEDDIFSWLEELQKITDGFNSKLDAIFEAKEQELREI